MEKEHIIKALDCCTRGRKSKDDHPCFECPYNECNLVGGTGERQISGTCQGWLMKDTLSLICEQEKRIEELTEENKKYREMVGSLAVKDGEVVGITVGKEVRYIEKGIADVFKNMAVAKAKADTVRKMQEFLCEGRVSNDPVVIDVNVAAKQLLEENT